MQIKDILENAVFRGASDIFIVAGLPVSFRIGGKIVRDNEDKLMPAVTQDLLNQI